MRDFAKKILFILRDIAALRISAYAGNAAFFLLLAVFPAGMLVLTALQYLPATVEDLAALASVLIPAPVYSLAEALLFDLQPGRTFAVLSATALGTLWSMTRATVCLTDGLDNVYGAVKKRPLLKKWGISFLSAILFLVCLLGTLLLQVFGGSIYGFAQKQDWRSLEALGSVLQMRSLFSIGFLSLVFCLFYTILPAGRQNFLQNLPGAVLAGFGWLLFSRLFGFYVTHFSRYSMIYGSLTAAVITMLWLYFCINLLFYGGLINRFLASSEHPLRKLIAYFRN